MDIKIIQREIYLLAIEEEMLNMSDGFIDLFNKYLLTGYFELSSV